MTVIGLLLLLFGFGLVVGESSEIVRPMPERLANLAVPAILSGGILCAIGVLVKLWQVMP